MTQRMTQKTAIAYVLDNCTIPADVAEKLESMKAQLEKPRKKSNKPSKAQIANAALREVIVNGMEPGHLYTATELAETFLANEEHCSFQRAAGLVRPLVEAGTIVKTVEKGKTYYSVG